MFFKTKNQVLISSINERDKLLPKEVSIYFWVSLAVGMISVFLTTEGAYDYAVKITKQGTDISLAYYVIFVILVMMIILRNVVLETVATYTKEGKNTKEKVANVLLNNNTDNLNPIRLLVGISITAIFFMGDYSYIKTITNNFKDNETKQVVKNDRELDYLDKKIKKAQNKLKELKNLRAEYIPNSKSIYKAKRKNAMEMIDKIDKKIEGREKILNDLINKRLEHLKNVDKKVDNQSKTQFFIALFLAIFLEVAGCLNVLRAYILNRESQSNSNIVEVANKKSELENYDIQNALYAVIKSIMPNVSNTEPIPNFNYVSDNFKRVEEKKNQDKKVEFEAVRDDEPSNKKIGFKVSSHHHDTPQMQQHNTDTTPPPHPDKMGISQGATSSNNVGATRGDIIGATLTKSLIKKLWNNGAIKRGGKLIPKKKVINENNRREDEKIRELYKLLVRAGASEYKPSKGYYALVEMNEALLLV